MRINSSVIGMESARRYTSSTTKYSRFLVKDYNGEAARGTKGTLADLLNTTEEEVGAGKNGAEEKNTEDSAEANMATKDAISELRERVESMRVNRINLRTESSNTVEGLKQSTIRYIFRMFFGKEKTEKLFGKDFSMDSLSESMAGTTSGSFQLSSNTLVLSTGKYYEENESTSFSTKGIVRTADGREISFNVDIGMSRKFTRYLGEELEIAKVNTCDPLVLNFDGDVAALIDQKFFFDIDGDGEEDEVSYLGSGSGYLALDKNGDGVINDGSELFGPKNGSGFADLAAYDEDGNGWIDEGDAIWSKLKIWCKNADGTDTLYTLAEKGVGAICLQNASTDFSLNGADNRTNGIIRSTGIFLYENGNVGTVQHLDVAR